MNEQLVGAVVGLVVCFIWLSIGFVVGVDYGMEKRNDMDTRN